MPNATLEKSKRRIKRKFDKTRALSWSAISSFEYDPEQWYRKYVLGQPDPETVEMRFGKEFAKSIEDGTCDKKYGMRLLPLLAKRKEYAFKVQFGDMQLIGFADAFDEVNKTRLDEVKTGKKPWDQARANGHGQIDMYLLMNYITHRIKPEDVKCSIVWVPTQEMGDFSIDFVRPIKPRQFPTKRTMQDILRFGARIKSTVKQMEKYAADHE